MAIDSDRRMDFWEPRRATTLTQARRRSALVGMLRMLFTIGAAVSAGWFLGHLVLHALASLGADQPPPATGVTMLNPRFSGRDAQGQPFVITATTAKQRRGDAQAVDLESPVLEDAAGTVVSAVAGIYDRQARTLELEGDVELLDGGGYRFASERATMYVQTNRIEGETPLNGFGPLGQLRADEYQVENGGETVILTGNVWTLITVEDE